MTLREFDENEQSVGELYNLACQQDHYELIEDIYSYDTISEGMYDNIIEYLRNNGWEDLRDALNDCNLNGDLFVYGDGWFDYNCIDDDEWFARDLKDQLRPLLIEDGYFDEEEDEDEVEDIEDVSPFDPVEEKVHEPEWFENDIECDVMALFA